MTLALIGFGEAGQAFATGWSRPDLAAHDLKFGDSTRAAPLQEVAARLGIRTEAEAANALRGASVVFCLVTADQAVTAARTAAPHLGKGTLWFDGNSCSPGAKTRSAEVIEATGARYVDTAIMAPVHPRLHRTPMLLSGPHAAAALDLVTQLGMSAKVAGDRVGEASAIKMLRSVIIKGLEALTAESFLAARRAGVEEAVLASLQASDPGIDWAARGAYNLERMLVHGARRSAEMVEVAATLRELGLPDRMAAATVDWQAELAALALPPGPDDLATRADAILGKLG